jgi:hypothetical protein
MKKGYILLISVLLLMMAVQFASAEGGNNETELECSVDTDCGSDEVCVNNECEDNDELENETEFECTVNTDCDDDEICLSGECEDNETSENETEIECTLNTDCDSDEICLNGECEDSEDENETECTVNADCDSDEVCVNNECEDDDELENETECTINADCDSDEICISGECEDEEDENETSEETGNESRLMFFDKGAEIRLVQLQIAINKALINGELVIDYIGDNVETPDVARMTDILDELEAIDAEIQEYRDAGVYDETSVEKFVQWKKDSWNLVKEFRDLAKEQLKDEDLSALKDLIKNADYTSIAALKEEIRTIAQEFNANRARELFRNYGTEREEVIEKIRNGEFNVEQAKETLRN